ncbi:tripartite tricarboxylate transporter substrate binding protein [Variovorax sp. J22G21]|uniref:Bug family tripartite tricarboxylate transporter substrate binding protein n=1 Tax=Variovorax fucosicus TaxID=3053517 RepID=UPI002577FD77|nr:MULTISPECIES: tripartite tricarboxylate transporter substrate binding protein [unclassified Variovorax]MDM0039166.1 tripartite tricarboxylate transporter substrate binding protein [Variovorax sp. J22R193]MDM0063942.1 tripartite tricarboxylate transporter substrate binding protein [Variovorax sp. J22G21]
MKTSKMRRICIAAGIAAGLTAALATPALAQTAYPSQPLKLVVPYPAGGATDTLARTIGQKLQEAWGQPALVDNRPGAGGTIGNSFVAKAPADGYTLLIAITALIQQPPLMEKLPYDPLKDLAPVTMIARSPSMLAVPLDSPAKDLKSFIAMVKASPGKYNFGSYGAGTSSHIQGALLNMQAGIDLVHVPFQGAAPLVTNLVGGQLASAFVDSASARPHLKSMRPLAVTGTQRMPGLPDVPTFAELGYHSFDPYGWFGVFLPAATPAPVVQKLSEEINRILHLPDVTAKIEALGLQVGGGKPEEFQKVVRTDAAIYAKIIKDANIRLAP